MRPSTGFTLNCSRKILINSSDKTLTTDVKSPSWDVAGYALADSPHRSGDVLGGFRYDYIRIPFEDQLDPSADTTSSFNRLSPRGGVSLDLGRGFSTYGSIGQSFRAPAVLELACADPTAACPLPFALGDDPPLDPVVGTTYELGGGYLGTKASITASVYRTDVRDDISFIQSSTAVFEGISPISAIPVAKASRSEPSSSPRARCSSTPTMPGLRLPIAPPAAIFSVTIRCGVRRLHR